MSFIKHFVHKREKYFYLLLNQATNQIGQFSCQNPRANYGNECVHFRTLFPGAQLGKCTLFDHRSMNVSLKSIFTKSSETINKLNEKDYKFEC